MSFVITAPETVAAAASDLASIGSAIGAAHAAAATATTAVIPAAADEVSAAISSLFGSYAQGYQALSTQAAAFHNQFVQLLNAGAQQYAAAEAANASPLQNAAAATTTTTTTTTTTNNPPPSTPPPTHLQVLEQDVNTVVNTIVSDIKGGLSWLDPFAARLATGFQAIS